MSSWISKTVNKRTVLNIPQVITNTNIIEQNGYIKYIAGGLLGDFLFQLSVVCEMYHKTGKKGILYIANIGDNFRGGIESAYNITKELVKSQEYIKEYTIYNGEKYDINLSSWRDSYYLWKGNWDYLFSNTYNINWGNYNWLSLPINQEFTDKIVVTHSINRYNNIEYYKSFFSKFNYNDIVFIYTLDEDLHTFKEKTTIEFNSYKCKDFYELAIIINSCKFHISNCSAPLSITLAIKKKSYIFVTPHKHEQILWNKLDLKFNLNLIR
jgi:hypothetical protein